MLRQGLSIMHAGAEGKEKVRDPQSETVHNESVPSPFLLPEGRDHITRNLQGAPFRWPPCLVVGNAGAHLRVRIPVSYTHLRAHETKANLVCRLLLEKKK